MADQIELLTEIVQRLATVEQAMRDMSGKQDQLCRTLESNRQERQQQVDKLKECVDNRVSMTSFAPLLAQVDEHENWINRTKGGITAIAFLAGSGFGMSLFSILTKQS